MNTTIAVRTGIEPALELMERVLRPAHNLAESYPLAFQEGFGGKVVQLADGAGARCALAVVPRVFVVPGGAIKLGLIGSVVTDSSHRRQGLASQALAAAEEYARREGCLGTLLWADDPGFYLGRGYRAVGVEVDIPLPQEVLGRLPSGSKVRPYEERDLRILHVLQLSQPVRVHRSLEETRALLRVPGCQILVAEENNQVVAYAILGRGEDLSHVIHEWAGDQRAVLSLLRAHGERFYAQFPGHSPGLFVIAPEHPLGVTQTLCDLGTQARRGVLGFGKLVDRQQGEERVAAAANVDLARARELLRGFSDRELLEALLPPRAESQNAIHIARSLGVPANQIARFPFAWGLDSI
jgi:GNAT superfamily N-acetyltransferase